MALYFALPFIRMNGGFFRQQIRFCIIPHRKAPADTSAQQRGQNAIAARRWRKIQGMCRRLAGRNGV
jgi:hypothetical protein